MAYESITLEVESEVTVTDNTVPLTGLWSTEEIGGWVWDRRRVESLDQIKSTYDTYLGGHTTGLLEGTRQEWWQSGTLAGIRFHDIVHYTEGDSQTWTPRVTVGAYALYHDARPLFSDYSYSEVFDTALNANGASRIELRDDCYHSTVSVTLFERDENFFNFKKHSYARVEEFTGQLSGGERLDTVDGDGNIVWANVETRKREFLIEDGWVLLNQDGSIEVGPLPSGAAYSDVEELLEYKGLGVPDGRSVYLDMWPVEAGSVKVYVVDGTSYEEWTETDSLNLSEETDKHFEVDHDLGIVLLGGYQAPDLVLAETITATATTIECFVDPVSLESYSDYGVIEIEGERLYYGSKTQVGFTDCVRGYGGTVAASHDRGVTVSDIQHGLGTGTSQKVYVAYKAVPRIEYEITESEYRIANAFPVVDVAPAKNVRANSILQILSSELHVATLTLETDSTPIGSNLYGPVYFGTDVSRLTATAYDSAGNTVEGIDITIEVFVGPGNLNGTDSSYTATSNSLGQVYAIYNAPYDRESVFHDVLSVTHVGADTVMVVQDLPDTSLADEVTVFQILKHDKTMGTIGRKTTIEYCSGNIIRITDVVGEQYIDGYLEVVGTDAVRYTRGIVSIFQTVVSGAPVTELHLDSNLNTALVTGQSVWLFEEEAEEWDPTTKNGVRVVLYEWDAGAIHPLTEASGAYSPVRPDLVEENQISFYGRNLSVPAPTDASSNLGGYIVVAPVVAQVYAWCRDPATGRLITSNTIKLRVELPGFLSGVDTSGALPIPYGFTFVTEEFNIGSGIGGANFLTINPRAQGINQFSIYAEV